jgi:PAS domain S-box-containing protein
MFTSNDPSFVMKMNLCGALGAELTTTFMFIFAVYFNEYDWFERKKWLLPLMLVMPGVAALLAINTNLINVAAHQTTWGFWLERGAFYPYHSTYALILSVLSVVITLSAIGKTTGHKKRQAIVYAFAFAFPIIAGGISEVLGPISGNRVMPLTSIFSTVTVIILGFEMVKHSFLGFTPALVSEKVIETMEDMLIVINKDCKIAFVNRATADKIGYRNEEMVGRNISDILEILRGKRFEEIEESHDLETEAIMNDGTKFPVSINLSRIFDNRGSAMGFTITMYDLRQYLHLIDKLSHSRDELMESTEELERFSKIVSGSDKELVKLKNELKRLQK